MNGADDPFQLQRFVDAQHKTIDAALGELRGGRKGGHWMWFVFPQLAGLGRSPASQFFAIRSAREARAYLAHPELGPRLRQCVEILLDWSGRRGAQEIFGSVDSMKLRSSLTLFAAVSGEPLFARALDAFFSGGPDPQTERLLGG